jgi:hypothetical protein
LQYLSSAGVKGLLYLPVSIAKEWALWSNLPSLDISYLDFLEKIKLTYINKIMSQLSHIKNTEKGKVY